MYEAHLLEVQAAARALAEMEHDPAFQQIETWRRRVKEGFDAITGIEDRVKRVIADCFSGDTFFPTRALEKAASHVNVPAAARKAAAEVEVVRAADIPDLGAVFAFTDRWNAARARLNNACIALGGSFVRGDLLPNQHTLVNAVEAVSSHDGEKLDVSRQVQEMFRHNHGLESVFRTLTDQLTATQRKRLWKFAFYGLQFRLGLRGYRTAKPIALRPHKGRFVLDLPILPEGYGHVRRAIPREMLPLISELKGMVDWWNAQQPEADQLPIADLDHLKDWLNFGPPDFETGTRKLLWPGAILVLQFNRVQIEMTEQAAMVLNLFLATTEFDQAD